MRENGRGERVRVCVSECARVHVCGCAHTYKEAIYSRTLNSDNQGNDLPASMAKLRPEPQPAACTIALQN